MDSYINGIADDKAIISLLVYLANKGYLKIEETEKRGLFSKSKGFKITKVKEYDGNNECEKIFFNGLFKRKSSGDVDIAKAREIVQEARLHGEKISFQDALEISMTDTNDKESVTESDLYDNFYTTLNRIKYKINSKENKRQIFETVASSKCKYIIIMIIAIFILITVKPVIEYEEYEQYGIRVLPFALFFPGAGLFVMFTTFFGGIRNIYVDGKTTKSGIGIKLVALLECVIGGGIPWAFIVLPCLLQSTMYLITYIIGIICIVILAIFAKIMPKRTPYGNEMLGKTRGFKRFLETAEKPQLEALVNENPEYFYNILPYTYALGVSDIWMNQFENIAVQAPNWYYCHGTFVMSNFNHFMNDTMRSAQNAMSSSPSSGSSGGSSGGGSGGGGSSGGGSGGGGGGSW